MTSADTISLLLPEIILIAAATIIVVGGAFVRLGAGASFAAAGGILFAAAAMFAQDESLGTFAAEFAAQTSGPIVVDLFGHAVRWAILAVGLVLVALTCRPREHEQSAEEAGSLLFILAGLMLCATANELILLFAGLELVSIPTYILLYIGRSDARGQESASKYFFLSILASAVLLYGFSFLYGVSGSTRFSAVAALLADPPETGNFSATLVPLALLFIFAGLAFRLTAVPFHFYAPDVYQGTSNANAGLMSTLPKIAGLVVLARIVLASLPGWEPLGWKIALVVSVATMTFGNVLALWQDNLRRMLAYSSIAHAGYLLIGVAVALAARTADTGADKTIAAGAINGLGSSLFYLGVYMFATLGTFAALVYLARGEKQIDTFDDIAGLNRRHPIVALLVAGFMFSLAGIPPLAGFWGKFSLLFGALTVEETSADGGSLRPWFLGLAIVTVINAAIGAAYYLRVIGAMYFRSPYQTAMNDSPDRARGALWAMTACAAVTLGIGFFPSRVLETANRAGNSLGAPVATAKEVSEVQSPSQPSGGEESVAAAPRVAANDADR